MKLSSYNLVHIGSILVRQFKNKSEYFIPDGNIYYRISRNNTEKSDNLNINIPCHTLTTMGKEIYEFLKTDTNADYLNAFAHFLKGENAKLEYAPIISKDEKTFRTGSFVPIVPK